jgi:NitT/TauT family transport system substrate-binding protein
MALRLIDPRRFLGLAAAALLCGGMGCAVSRPRPPAPAARGVDPARVYAGYHFSSRPNVLSFGVQPLWIPACVVWEAMARDPQLQADLRRAGFRLEAYSFFKGQDLNDFLRSGKLQGGVAGDLPVLKAAAASEIRIAGLIQQGPCSIIAREMLRPEDLPGHAVGYGPGSNAHYTLLRALKEHRVNPASVRLIPMDVTEMPAALADGRIDAFSAWEPTPAQALMDHPDWEVVAQTETRGFIYFDRAFFQRHPEVVRAVIASEIRVLRWLRLNGKNVYVASGWAREEAIAFRGEELPLTTDDFHRLARMDVLRIPDAPRLRPELLEEGGELRRQFLLSRQFALLPPEAAWDRVRQSFVPELAPQILASAAPSVLNDYHPGQRLQQGGL